MCPPGKIEVNGQCEQRVVVVWDATDDVGCEATVQIDDGPEEPASCLPGALIQTAEMTENEAINAGFSTYVVLTGDAAIDDEAIDITVDALHDAIAPTVITPADCSVYDKVVRGSYVVDGLRTYYSMAYHVGSNCSVTRIDDQAFTNSIGSGLLRWQRSCSNGRYSCSSRNIVLTTTPTSFKSVPSSYLGRYYRTYSLNLDSCAIGFCRSGYGYWQFD